MADRVSSEVRSRMMSTIRNRDTSPELAVRKFLHASGFRYRLHDRRLPGRPDIVLPRYAAVVEVRGCYWHSHPGCALAVAPSSNTDFWARKLSGTVERDRRNEAALRKAGWRVFVVWECELSSSDRLIRLASGISGRANRSTVRSVSNG